MIGQTHGLFVVSQFSRSLKLKNLPQCEGLSGGAAVEKLARGGDPQALPLPQIMSRNFDCDFSFGGVLESYLRHVASEEEKQGNSAVLKTFVVLGECEVPLLRHKVCLRNRSALAVNC